MCGHVVTPPVADTAGNSVVERLESPDPPESRLTESEPHNEPEPPKLLEPPPPLTHPRALVAGADSCATLAHSLQTWQKGGGTLFWAKGKYICVGKGCRYVRSKGDEKNRPHPDLS